MLIAGNPVANSRPLAMLTCTTALCVGTGCLCHTTTATTCACTTTLCVGATRAFVWQFHAENFRVCCLQRLRAFCQCTQMCGPGKDPLNCSVSLAVNVKLAVHYNFQCQICRMQIADFSRLCQLLKKMKQIVSFLNFLLVVNHSWMHALACVPVCAWKGWSQSCTACKVWEKRACNLTLCTT